MTEIWLPIPGWPEYSVSNHGRIRSEPRVIIRRNGAPYRVPERIMRPARKPDGLLTVALARHGRYTKAYVHRLIQAAFNDDTDGQP